MSKLFKTCVIKLWLGMAHDPATSRRRLIGRIFILMLLLSSILVVACGPNAPSSSSSSSSSSPDTNPPLATGTNKPTTATGSKQGASPTTTPATPTTAVGDTPGSNPPPAASTPVATKAPPDQSNPPTGPTTVVEADPSSFTITLNGGGSVAFIGTVGQQDVRIADDSPPASFQVYYPDPLSPTPKQKPGPIDWAFSVDPPQDWISLEPSSGKNLSFGSQQTVTIKISVSKDMEAGTYPVGGPAKITFNQNPSLNYFFVSLKLDNPTPTPTSHPATSPTSTSQQPVAPPTPTSQPVAPPTPTSQEPVAPPTPTSQPIAPPTPTSQPVAPPTPTSQQPVAPPTSTST